MHMFRFFPRLIFLAVLGFSIPLSLANAAEPSGLWLTQNGDARIRVAKCGNAMCGTIVWLRDAIDAQTGQPPVDSQNPDPARRSRKIVGLRIFAMPPDGNGGYAGGIYNSDDGQTYAGKITLQSQGQLQVQGCAGPLCGSETWSKVGR
jgi:uncharacterized protein (DUF2147 family)